MNRNLTDAIVDGALAGAVEHLLVETTGKPPDRCFVGHTDPLTAIFEGLSEADKMAALRYVAHSQTGKADPDGLGHKYTVMHDGEPVRDAFVLVPEEDRAARSAIRFYAGHADVDDALAWDLREWLEEVSDGAEE